MSILPLHNHDNNTVVGRKPAGTASTETTMGSSTGTGTGTTGTERIARKQKQKRKYKHGDGNAQIRDAIPKRYALVVRSLIGVLWVIFRLLECFLWILESKWLCRPKQQQQQQQPQQKQQPKPKTVVIVGGSFAGLAALRELLSEASEKTKNNLGPGGLEIVLIDRNDYSEYTPGILRLFCEPGRFFDLAQALPADDASKGFRRIQGTVTSLVERSQSQSKSQSQSQSQSENANFNSNSNSNANATTIRKVLTYLPVSSAADGSASTTTTTTKPETLEYDYLILATGATYHAPISASPGTSTTLLDRYRDWKRAHEKISNARSVIVLGGGAVGVELAAEIVDHQGSQSYSQSHSAANAKTTKAAATRVTIVDAQTSLVPLFPRAVGAYAEEWLAARGVELRLGESLRSWTDRTCTLADGTVLHADAVYVCFGSRPNSEPLGNPGRAAGANNGETEPKNGPLPGFLRTERGTVRVRDTLQVALERPSENDAWFACGDVASPPTGDEKQAFQAELQGKLAARNVLRLLRARASGRGADAGAGAGPKQSAPTPPQPLLLSYPRDAASADRVPLVFVLSLGKSDGVLGFNRLCVPGPLAAVVKYVLEDTKVSHMRGEKMGALVWKIGDALTLWLSRTLLTPAKATATTTTTTKMATDAAANRESSPAATATSTSTSTSTSSLLFPALHRRDVEPQRKRS